MAGRARQSRLRLGGVDLLLDRPVKAAVEEHCMIVAARAPLRRASAGNVLHVFNRFPIPLVVERGEVMRRRVPLLVNVRVAARLPAGLRFHKEIRGNETPRVGFGGRRKERGVFADPFACHIQGRFELLHETIVRLGMALLPGSRGRKKKRAARQNDGQGLPVRSIQRRTSKPGPPGENHGKEGGCPQRTVQQNQQGIGPRSSKVDDQASGNEGQKHTQRRPNGERQMAVSFAPRCPQQRHTDHGAGGHMGEDVGDVEKRRFSVRPDVCAVKNEKANADKQQYLQPGSQNRLSFNSLILDQAMALVNWKLCMISRPGFHR